MAGTTGFALIVGASRGLGLGLAGEYLARGWRVLATVRDRKGEDGLRGLAEGLPGTLEIAHLDVDEPGQIRQLGERLAPGALDLLFVNAGVTNRPSEPIGEVETEEFARVMLTNVLGPMRVVEWLADRVADEGTIAAMSSNMASVSLNEAGSWEVYRASKSALNMLMKCYSVRRGRGRHTLLAVSPGWVRTDMGGDAAPLDVATSVRGIADMIERRRGSAGFFYVDYQDRDLPW